MNKEIIQGVKSQIDFPIGQDEIAITKAIQDLLKEGWQFYQLTNTHISLARSWEYRQEGGLEEVKKSGQKENLTNPKRYDNRTNN